MREKNSQQLSELKNELYNEDNKRDIFILFSLLLINLIIIYSYVIIFYYIANYEKIIAAYYYSHYSYYLSLVTIVIIIRILFTIYLTFFFFNKWISRKDRHYLDISFLFGLFFYFLIPGKLFDLLIYTKYVYPEAFPYFTLLNMAKFRYIIGILNTLPLFFFGIYLYFFKHYLEKPVYEREILIRKRIMIFSSIYIITFIILIIKLQTIMLLQFWLNGTVLISVSLVIWVFIIAHKKRLLAEINSFLICIGFIIYLISNIMYPILVFYLTQITNYGYGISALIVETIALISSLIILIGFKSKASY